jgi:hypothetical protein
MGERAERADGSSNSVIQSVSLPEGYNTSLWLRPNEFPARECYHHDKHVSSNATLGDQKLLVIFFYDLRAYTEGTVLGSSPYG